MLDTVLNIITNTSFLLTVCVTYYTFLSFDVKTIEKMSF